MGTGIGGGLILENCLYHGARGAAGEIGHVKISSSENAAKCGCGGRGCLEAYAGANALRRLTLEEIKLQPKSILAKLVRGAVQFSPELVSKAASLGCKSAEKVWGTVGKSLGAGIAAAGNLLDLDAVVLTGGVANNHKFFMPALKARLAEEKMKTPFKDLKIIISKMHEAGGTGAALYALDRYNEN
jgi:glucokinase